MDVEVAQRLVQRRKQAGYSQEALAEKLGVSRQAVSKWERSESSPDTDNLILLAQLYGISLDDLLFSDTPAKANDSQTQSDRAQSYGSEAREESNCETRSNETADSSADEEAFPSENEPNPDDLFGSNPKSTDSKPKVEIGLDGIHIEDKNDYVHVSWADGVHVKDGKKGEEVHVGWDGVHIKDANTVIDGGLGHGVHGASKDGVIINGQYFDSWKDAHDAYHFDDKRIKGTFEKSWNRFPFPLLVVIAIIALGGLGIYPWGPLFFLLFTIPIYYTIGGAIGRKSPAMLVQGAYPVIAVGVFCYAAIILGEPSPAWLLLLSIPVVAILTHRLSKWWKHRKAK